MSDTNNPYQSPEADVRPVAPLTSGGALTDTMLAYLRGASPWLRFVGIVGFIGCGVTVITGVMLLVMIPLTTAAWESVLEIRDYAEAFGALFGGVMGVYCLVAGVLLFFPCLYTYNFGTKIRDYDRSGRDEELEAAFKNNKALWKFTGIITIVGLALIPVTIIVGIIIGVVMAL
jgi:hypothetical protein